MSEPTPGDRRPPVGPGGGWADPSGAPSPPPSGPPAQPAPPAQPGQPVSGWGQLPPPAHGAAPWVPPPKPGVVPLRPLGLGELLDGSVQTMRQNPRVMLGLSAVLMAACGVVSTLFVLLGAPRMYSALGPSDGQVGAREIARAASGFVVAFVAPAVLQGLAVVVLTGVLILAVSEAVLGRHPGVGQVWAKARGRVPALVGLSLLTGLVGVVAVAVPVVPGVLLLVAGSTLGGGIALALGVLASVVAVVLLFVRFAFAAPALLLEDLGVVAALRRSWRLVGGSWWRALGILALSAVIAGAVNGLLQVPFSLLGSVVGAIFGPGGSATDTHVTLAFAVATTFTNIGTVIATTVTAPFSAGVTALLYIDLRIRREGLDVALARAAAQAP